MPRPLVPRRVAPLLAAALLAPLLVVGALAPAQAAPACTVPGVKAASRAAAAIFVGTVESSTVSGTTGGRGTSIVHRVRVSGVWKGTSDITTDDVEVVTRGTGARSGCPLGRLAKDDRFVFFAQPDGDAWAVAADDGTTEATQALTDQLDRIYGAASAPVSPEPQPAVFSPVDTAAPLSTGRAAAPGAALVLLGLLGLVVVRRVNRG